MKKQSTSKGKKEVTYSYDDAEFLFDNEDIYTGGYKFHRGQILLVKEGKGVYVTDNFDVYDGEWIDDSIADSDIHIRYNNNAQYRGRINSNGSMKGPGTYIFPDGSSIEAYWLDNIPIADIIFREPLGFTWTVESVLEDVKMQIQTP